MILPPGNWQSVALADKTADVYHPSHGGPVENVIIYLHGHALSTLSDKPVYTELLERYGWACICPHGQRSWWTDVVCPEFDPQITPLQFLRTAVLEFIQSQWQVQPPKIGLLGVSMGGQGVLQWAYREPRRVPVVAALAPAVDFHQWWGQGLPLDEMFSSREAARQATVILQLNPLNWPRHQFIACDPTDLEWFDSSDKLCMKLSSSGVLYERDLKTSAGGHTWDYFNHIAPRVMQFLDQGLKHVSRQG